MNKCRRFLSIIFNKDDHENWFFSTGWLLVLYILGLFLWSVFLNWGNIPFDFHDWAEVNAPRMAFLRDAVIKGELPLHMPDASALRNLTDRFMSLPDVILTPQVFLMRFMEVGPYIWINTLLLYSLGFWGLLRIKKRFHLSLVVFSFLFLLFNFNGHILAHTSIGHITWGGYYLFPWFLLLVLQLLDGENRWTWSVEMAILLFFTFLQGSFHPFIWECMFIGLLLPVAWRQWKPILTTLLLAAGLCMVRFLPPTLLLGQFDTDFYGGYRLPWQILQALVKQVTPASSAPFENFGSNLGYWEFDLYIGWAGVLFLMVGLIFWIIPQVKNRHFSPLWLPMIGLTLFAIRDFYYPLAQLPIPLLNAERVSSRMAILPLVFGIVLAADALQQWLNRRQPGWVIQGISLVALVYLGFDLIRRVYQWQVLEAYPCFPNTPVNLAIKIVANHADAAYTNLLIIGGLVTIITLIAAGILVYRESRR